MVSSFKTINKLKKREELKTESDLIENEKLLIAQIAHAVPSSEKEISRNYTESTNNCVI